MSIRRIASYSVPDTALERFALGIREDGDVLGGRLACAAD
jgi:hypothetical protein